MHPNLSGTSFTRYVVLILWIVISGIYISLAGQWIYLTLHDKEFADYTEHLLRVATMDPRSPGDLRNLMMTRARSLSLPLDENGIVISETGSRLRAIVRYEADVRIPIISRPVYRLSFEHDLSSRPQKY